MFRKSLCDHVTYIFESCTSHASIEFALDFRELFDVAVTTLVEHGVILVTGD